MRERRADAGSHTDGDTGAARDLLTERGVGSPSVAVILGSGLSGFADGVDERGRVPYSDVPGFPRTAVAGHSGTLVWGELGGADALVFAGRVHHYEGHAPEMVTFSVRLAASLGVRTLIITNAAGGLDPGFEVGDLMVIRDHINAMTGPRRLPGAPFAVAGAYSLRLASLASEVALERGIRLRSGVYLGSSGPTYETPAEIRALRSAGASAVGMSTVSEVSEAARQGLEVLGVALITNVPLPGRADATTHAEVLAAGRRGGLSMLSLVSGVLERL